MQVFKLPRPVLCIGGILQVDLLGRVQTQEMDQLYYIWCVILNLSPVFKGCSSSLKDFTLVIMVKSGLFR